LASRNNLATAYQVTGNLDRAIPLFERTLKEIEAKLEVDHPRTLVLRYNLANAYRAVGRLDLAIPLFERTLKAQQARLGDDHPDTLRSRSGLAGAFVAAGNLDLAIPLFERTLKARETKLGVDHPHTLISRNNLATAYQDVGKLDQAIPLFEKVVLQAQKKLGPTHQLTLEFTQDWIDALTADRQYARALQAGKELLAVQRRQFGSNNPGVAVTLTVLGRTLVADKQPLDAEAALRESLAIRTRNEPDAWTTFNTQSMLGAALLGQKKYADAEPLLVRGYEGMRQRQAKISPRSKVRLTEALERLVQLYEVTGTKDQAAKWRHELEIAQAARKQR
jgi:tetratricopeptide (TPR) repeat protein